MLVMVVVVAADLLLVYRYRAAYDVYLAEQEAYLRLFNRDYFPRLVADDALVTAQRAMNASYQAAEQYFDTASATRPVLGLAALLALLALAGGDRASVGMIPVPVQGWKFWFRIGLVISLSVLAVAILLAGVWLLVVGQIRTNWDGQSDFDEAFREAILRAPIFEELIYRIAICVPVAACWGMRASIVVSGVLFGFLHVLYGNANPVNLIAGFFLAWTFLKSNTILVPMIIHLVGNLFFLYGQLALITWKII
jgi:membrane protease YdiL (CAAX protease family)